MYFIQLYISYSKLNRFIYQHDPCFTKSTVRGTVKEKPGFTPGEDAAALRKAMEGIGKLLPRVWTFIELTLYTSSGDVEILLLSDCWLLAVCHNEELCVCVCNFSGTTEKTLIDILTQRSNAQRQLICKAYQDATGKVKHHIICTHVEQAVESWLIFKNVYVFHLRLFVMTWKVIHTEILRIFWWPWSLLLLSLTAKSSYGL